MIHGFGQGDEVTTEIGDVVIVGGQPAGPPLEVEGKKPPLIPSSWWPWLIAGGAAAALWWITRDERSRPLARAGG